MLTPQNLVQLIQNYDYLIYIIMFLGSFIETIFPFSLIIPGEIFFYSGTILSLYGVINIYILFVIMVIGGILGDSTSYFIGNIYGRKLFKKENKFLNKKNLDKGEKIFEKYGDGKAVFLARFLGPLSWIIPFIAGINNMKYKNFLKFNIPAVILGIGQVIFIAYLIGLFGKTFFIDTIKNLTLINIIEIILILTILYFLIKIIIEKMKLRTFIK